MQFDLIALDIDGTILDGRGHLDPILADAIGAVTAAGVRVVLATGRSPWSGIAALVDRLGLDGPQISMQGALVADPLDGEVHLAQALSARIYLEALSIADELGLDPVVAVADGHRAERLPEWIGTLTPARAETRAFRYVRDLAYLCDEPPFRVFLPTGAERHEAVRGELVDRFGARATVMWCDSAGVEILAPGVDKGTALAFLAGALGIPMARVAAVGDARNDMGMLLRAGRSAAMGSAPSEVRAVANLVVPPVEDGGALVALHAFFPELFASARAAA